MPDNLIIYGTGNGLIKILNIETAQCIQTINAHANIINNILLMSNKTFLTCSQDGTIKYFDLDTFDCIRTFNGHSHSVYSINKISTDKFVSTSLDRTIRIWSMNKSKCLKVIEADSCRNLIVISDKIIISHKGKSLFIWNVKTGTKTGEIEINDQYVMSFIKLTSTKIATGHKNGSIKIWDITTQKCLQTIEKMNPWCLTKISNNLIVFGYDSSIIKILDIKSGNCIKSLGSQTKVNLETIGIDLF